MNDILFVIIELFSLALTVEALHSSVKTRCYQEGVYIGHFQPRFQGKRPSLGNIFGFYKTRHILLYDSANCTVLHAVVFTQYRRVIDGQTDGQKDPGNFHSEELSFLQLFYRALAMNADSYNTLS